MDTLTQILQDYNLAAMRDRLNAACGTGETLTLPELQEIRAMVKRLARAQLNAEIDAFVARARASERESHDTGHFGQVLDYLT